MTNLKSIKQKIGIGFGILAASLSLSGCGGNSPKTTALPAETPLSTVQLKAAASFLGAATGKESALSVDNIVFINSALGINQVQQDSKDLYGDLWVLLRNSYGAPILDANGCVQPIASEPVLWPDNITRNTVPMQLSLFQDGQYKCEVVPGYEQYTIDLEIGRLNMVRTMATNPDVFARSLQEVINDINAADAITTDAAGRIVMITYVGGVAEEATIDSPRDNLAMYMAIMKQGRIAGYGPETTSGGSTVPPQWMEIRPDLPMGSLSFLRDGIAGRPGGVTLINGYADLSRAYYVRKFVYGATKVDYIQYTDNTSCHYTDMQDYAWSRIFYQSPFSSYNMDGFLREADDARRVVVFTHDVIQDLPDTGVPTLPAPAGSRIGNPEQAAAAFLGAASNKGVPLNVDGLVFVNTVLGLNNVSFDYKGEIYGDLWELTRDSNGEPILDSNGCPQPISSQGGTVPMEKDDTGECIVVPGYENDVIEVELGRLNGARVALTNPRILDQALNDVMNTINSSIGLKLEVSGRLVYTNADGIDSTIDSPRANLALYWALMKWGKLDGDIEVRQDGSWVTKHVSITLDDSVLDAQGLGFLKHGSAACQANAADCGAKQLPSGYLDYSGFSHNSSTVYNGVNVNYVERQTDPSCGYVDKTDSIMSRILGNDTTDYTNIAAAVQQAEDTRKIIQFIHTVIQDPVAVP